MNQKGSGPSVIVAILAVVMAVCFVATLVMWFQSRAEIADLEVEVDLLRSDLTSLNSTYASLQAEHSSLQTEYNHLNSDYYELKSSYDQLKSDYEALDALYQALLEVPHAYYPTWVPYRPNTQSELQDFLTYEFTLPTGYMTGVFDCSESAAYLEWALERAGFDAEIVVGPAPWDPSLGYHAWVIAHTDDPYRVAIEPTALTGGLVSKLAYLFTGRAPGVVYKGDEYASGYYDEWEYKFKNVYCAVEHYRGAEEWNWWAGYWGFI